MSNSRIKDAAALIIVLTIWATLVVGWILNIVQLVQHDEFVVMTAVKIVGIFIAPLGAILGLLNI